MGCASSLRVLDEAAAGGLRALQPPAEQVGGLAARASALADPTRVGLAVALRDGGEVCVCDLSWILDRPVQLVSHHLTKMRAAGIVAARRDGRLVFCTLTPSGARLLDALAPATEATGPRDADPGAAVRA